MQEHDFLGPARLALFRLREKPYENLGKIVAHARGSAISPSIGIRDFSAGATCFSMTYHLRRELKSQGFICDYLLADQFHRDTQHTPTRSAMHCALWIHPSHETQFSEGAFQGWIADPGYSLFEPMPIPHREEFSITYSSPFTAMLSREKTQGIPPGYVRLYSGLSQENISPLIRTEINERIPEQLAEQIAQRKSEQSPEQVRPRAKHLKYRMDYLLKPASVEAFHLAWKDSFTWPMMEYPVLSQIRHGQQWYLQKNNLYIRDGKEVTHRILDQDGLRQSAIQDFGLEVDLVEAAMAALILKKPRWWPRP